jgi:hypothetical protein
MSKLVVYTATAAALAVAGAALAAVAVAASAGSGRSYMATMAPGAEVPKPNAPAAAKGTFTATLTSSGSTRTFRWKLTFKGLSGTAVGAHVHKGKPGIAGAVVVPLCGPCRNGQTGQAKISKGTADLLEHGRAYVNVHTGKNAAGEIRGQVKLLDNSSSARPSQPNPGTTTTITPPPGYGGGGGGDPTY